MFLGTNLLWNYSENNNHSKVVNKHFDAYYYSVSSTGNLQWYFWPTSFLLQAGDGSHSTDWLELPLKLDINWYEEVC